MDYFNNNVPSEIQLDIFSRVPAEFIRDPTLVCKSWNNLIHHPSFSRIHLHRINHNDSGKVGFLASTKYIDAQEFKYFEYNHNHESTTPIERIKRVNLKTAFYRTSICICNPITREHIILPKIQFCDTNRAMWSSGFGYVSSTNEYKVVGIRVSPLMTTITEVHIYTLGSGNGWRNLGKFDIDFGQNCLKQGVFANGALYWIGGKNLGMIITFDLADEHFCKHLSPPVFPPNGNWVLNGIGVLDGFLYFAVLLATQGEGGIFYDIWLLEKKNDLKVPEGDELFGWTKKYRLEERNLVAVTKSNGVLTYSRNYLNIYGPKASTSEMLLDLKEWIREIYPHKNTLVSLKELGEEDVEIMESIEIEKTENYDSPLLHPDEVEAVDTLVSLKELITGKKIGR
ncbi:F-box protein At3g49450-like [Papaver somniferum]|uniref:F-box protein At3g49450-like n=1 Tax=Papaver somniferum TaxID=3469 RepID=UPI000E6FF474|nr:F-box protein At3g49450-like [Papaver somniferum]